MGTGASKAGNQSIHALKVIKRMQRTSDNADQSTKANGAFDQESTMPIIKVQNGVTTSQKKDADEGNASQKAAVPPASSGTPKAAAQGQEDQKTSDAKTEILESTKEASDDGEDKEEDKPLTEEEIKQKIDKFYQTLTAMISLCKTICVTDESDENKPYCSDFRAFILKLAKSYFHFKTGETPYSSIRDFRLQVGKFMSEAGCTKLLCDVAAEGLEQGKFMDDEGKTKTMFFLPLKNCILTLLNYSDACREVKLCIGSHEALLSEFVNLTKSWKDKHLQKELSDNQDKILKWCVSIFHNCATLDENVPLLRDLGVIPAVQPYLDSPISTMRLSAVSTLADIVNEEEAELLQANPSIYKFLLKTLKLSLEEESHKNLGWSAEELTRAVRQLARNDANKKILVDLGCLPLLTRLLAIGNEREIKEALDCLWILSFNEGNKKAMMEEISLVDHVVQKYHQGIGTMKYACHGLLWSLKDHLVSEDKYKDIGNEVSTFQGQAVTVGTPSPESPESPQGRQFKGHVMISYQWANQETIKRIANELRAHNIPIWLDIDYMGGSTLQAMAKAVEDSFAVIVAMSQKYKDSPNTRAEAEYAFQTRKTIIPLIMQHGYRPDGWLGLILGSKLYYEFSGKYSFESRMNGLLKAILDIQDSVDGKRPEQPVMTMTKSVVLTSPTKPVARPVPLKAMEIKDWQSEQIKKWLAKYKLDTVTSMTKLSGEELLFLFKLKSEAPEFFYHCLETKLQLESLLDLSRASEAIAGLGV